MISERTHKSSREEEGSGEKEREKKNIGNIDSYPFMKNEKTLIKKVQNFKPSYLNNHEEL